MLDHSLYEMVEVMSAALHHRAALSDSELALIERVYDIVTVDLTPPDSLIRIPAPLDQLLERIRARNRPFERPIDLDYLEAEMRPSKRGSSPCGPGPRT